jgi:uracil phosphoribosyltransferase
MRSSTTEPSTFRAALREVTYHLGYEATSRLTTQSVKISIPVPRKDGVGGMDHLEHKGFKLKERIALIPKIRSGLGMVDSMLELLPNAAIHHIGMYKVDGQHPVQYFNRLPRKCEADVAYILDPVISTSSTIVSLVSILKKVRTIINIVFIIFAKLEPRFNFHILVLSFEFHSFLSYLIKNRTV